MSTQPSTIINTASVSGKQTDPNPDNDSHTEDTIISIEADLSVAKTDDPDPVVAGEQLTYTITVANVGPSDAAGVKVIDTLPDEVNFVSASAGCDELEGIVTCVVGDLGSDDSAIIDIVVEVDSSTIVSITNTVEVSGNETDPNPDNNSHIEDTAVESAACILDLTLNFADGILIMDFNLGTPVPATWTTLLLIPGTPIIPLWSFPVSALDPPFAVPVEIPGLPSLGTVAVITALIPTEGAPCFTFDFVDTGQPSSTLPTVEELQKLIPNLKGVAPSIEK